MNDFGGFLSPAYRRINARRLEHLATLDLPLAGRRVLELGSGIGDLSHFFLDRGCEVTALEGRDQNLAFHEEQYGSLPSYPGLRTLRVDFRAPPSLEGRWEIVFCYGLLYHLERPGSLLKWAADRCSDLLLLETVVAWPGSSTTLVIDEPTAGPTQALDGRGCRPDRANLRDELGVLFPHVYVPRVQPWHEDFPLDWTARKPPTSLPRTIFVASRRPLPSSSFSEGLPSTLSRR